MNRFFHSLFIGLFSISLGCSAQSPHMASSHRPAAAADSDAGHVHHAVSTSNPQAQHQFDRGLALVYAFNHDEAIHSFKRAAELDPQLAMAHWGIALALGPNYNIDVDDAREKEAAGEIKKAVALSSHASEPELEYIRALATRYSDAAKPDLSKLAHDYNNAMRNVMRKYPDDLDAATLFADSAMVLRPWKLWSHDQKPAEGTEEIVATLQSVLQRDPDHLGANHLYIHAVEASPHPEYALDSAARLPDGAPSDGGGHLIHMPSHIYARVGDYEAAAGSNEAAVEADRAYMKAFSPHGPYPMMYFSHNLSFLAFAHATQGNYADAIKAANELVAHVSPHLAHMPMLEGFLPAPMIVNVRFRRWDEILRTAAPEPSLHATTAIYHFARGLAHANTGNLAAAQADRAAFEAARKQIPSDAMYSPQNNASIVFTIAENVLDAQIALAKQDKQLAVKHLRAAVAAEDTLNYMEPPDWYGPVRETLGGVLFRDGQYLQAEQVFRQDLQHNVRNPRSLFGLVETLKARGDAHGAELIEPQFKSAWKNADTTLRIDDL